MREESRGAFIEKFYTTPEFVFKYQQFKSKMERIQQEIKTLHDFQKELKQNKEAEKLKVGSLRKFRDAVKDFNKSNEEFLLFELYHNNKAIESGPQNMAELQRELEETKERHSEVLGEQGNYIEDFVSHEAKSLESNLNLRVKLKEKLNTQQNLENIRQEVEFLELQIDSNFSQLNLSTFQKEIDKHTQKLIELDASRAKLEPIHEEFTALKRVFMRDNLKILVPFSTMKKLIFNDFASVQETLKLFEIQLATLVTDRISYEEKKKSIEAERGEITKEIEKLVEKKMDLSTKAYKKTMAISKLEPITNLKRKVKSNKQSILDKLRNKFSYSIVGYLSDLFDVIPVNDIEVKHNHILERLGKYSGAIVVDSQEIADKCVDFLKLQGHQQVSTLFIPLSNIKEMSTADLMAKYKLPENMKMEPIENFIQAKHPEIQKLIMNILKPTIVTDKMPNLEYIFNEANQNIRVTTFEGFITLNPDGSTQTHSRYNLNADFPDETLMMMKENLQTFRLELIELNAEMDILNLKLAGYGHKREFYDRFIKMINALLKANSESIQMTKKKVDQAKETLKKLENVKGLAEIKKKFNEFKEILQPLEAEHYKDFLEKSGYTTIEEYEKESGKVFPSSNYENNRKLYTSKVETNEKIKAKLIASHATPKQLEAAKKRLDTLQQTFETIDNELTEIREQNNKINDDLKASYKTTLEKRAKINELEKKAESLQLQICDEMINIQIALTESFRLLYLALVNCDQIPLNEDGSLLDLLNMPGQDDLEDNFNLIRYAIER